MPHDTKLIHLNNLLEDFCTNRVNETRLHNLIISGLNIFKEILEANFCLIYFMNEESFEFDHYISYPPNETINNKEVFSFLVKNNVIGNALGSGRIIFYPDAEDKLVDDYYLVLPMLSPKGVIGLVIINTNLSPNDVTHSLLNTLNIFLNLYTSSVENLILQDDKIKTKDLLDQLVASRTLRLAAKKSQLDEKIESMKMQFTRSIPHEVRTPINQIIGFTRLLMKDFQSIEFEDAKEMLTDINSSAERLKRLFENYLFYASLSIQATNVVEMTRVQEQYTLDAESIIVSHINSKATEFNRTEDVSMNIAASNLKIPLEYLMKIVEELFDNCIKYSEAGTKILINSYIEGKDYFLLFKDFGRGMSQEQIEKIDAYQQFDRMVYEQQGLGLGLSIVTKVLAIIGGEISFNSELNKYTEVVVKFNVLNEDDFE